MPDTLTRPSDKASNTFLTAGCLFSGMGGFASGLANAGFDIRWANDNDQFACTTFASRFPDVPLHRKSIEDLSVAKDRLAPVKVLAGGFPCQSFSQAGTRKGFDDPRGKLFFRIPVLISEWSPEQRPWLVILENVPHLVTGADGEWFDEIRRALRKAGYWFRESSCWKANVKDFTELPQDRERLFMVAASQRHFPRNPFSPPSQTTVKPRPIGDLINRREKGEPNAYLPTDNRYFRMISNEMAGGQSENNIYQLRRSYVREKKNGLCPTLTANMGIGGHNVPFIRDEWGIRRLSVMEIAQLQGFDDIEFPDIPEQERYRLLGNAVCVKLAQKVGEICAKALEERENKDE